MILSLVTGAPPIFYGMRRAVVIACEAGNAPSVVHPLWVFVAVLHHVCHRTASHTKSAANAAVFHHMERFVRKQPTNESPSQQSAVGLGPMAGVKEANVGLALPDDVRIPFQVFLSLT